jgi:hypothetical protein
MLDVVRHHGEHGGDEKPAKIAVLKRREGDFFLRAGWSRRACDFGA